MYVPWATTLFGLFLPFKNDTCHSPPVLLVEETRGPILNRYIDALPSWAKIEATQWLKPAGIILTTRKHILCTWNMHIIMMLKQKAWTTLKMDKMRVSFLAYGIITSGRSSTHHTQEKNWVSPSRLIYVKYLSSLHPYKTSSPVMKFGIFSGKESPKYAWTCFIVMMMMVMIIIVSY